MAVTRKLIFIPELIFVSCEHLSVTDNRDVPLLLKSFVWLRFNDGVETIFLWSVEAGDDCKQLRSYEISGGSIEYKVFGYVDVNSGNDMARITSMDDPGLSLLVKPADRRVYREHGDINQQGNVIIILYNPNKLLNSTFLDNGSIGQGLPYICNLTFILRFLKKVNGNTPLEYGDQLLRKCPRQTCPCAMHVWTKLVHFFVMMSSAVLLAYSTLIKFSHQIVQAVTMRIPALSQAVHWFSRYSVTLKQVVVKVKQCQSCVTDEAADRSHICCRNITSQLVVDMVLGILLLLLLHPHLHLLSYKLLVSTKTVADQLITLLNWLMGVPAGLKLNRELNESLGTFFLYHVHLWKTYIITFIEPNLVSSLSLILYVGVGGISLQISLLLDLISILTFHISCFYIYAARLYFIITYGMCSLWKLFRGKKWNVLRCRLDTLDYDLDQLFLGTLIFTMLLFLYPTAFLYYSVFAGLHVLLLLGKQLFLFFLHFLNSTPLYLMMMRLVSSSLTIGDCYFELNHFEGDVSLKLKCKQVGYAKIFQLYETPAWTHGPALFISTLPGTMYRVLWGYLTFDLILQQ